MKLSKLKELCDYMRGFVDERKAPPETSKFLIGSPTPEMIEGLKSDGWRHVATYSDYWEFHRPANKSLTI